MAGWQERISINPAVCHGQGCIRGTRVLVSAILDNLAAGVPRAEILASYPSIQEPVALHLRAMNMLYEAIKERGAMVIVPSSVVETMSSRGVLATVSLGGAKPV